MSFQNSNHFKMGVLKIKKLIAIQKHLKSKNNKS